MDVPDVPIPPVGTVGKHYGNQPKSGVFNQSAVICKHLVINNLTYVCDAVENVVVHGLLSKRMCREVCRGIES